MTRSMTRWTLAGCMALAAMGTVAVLDVGSSTAEAAPSVSPYAGTYVGRDPQGWRSSWTVTISDGGRITGSLPSAKGSVSGKVGDDGSYSFAVSMAIQPIPGEMERGQGPKYVTVKYDSAGTMALVDGDIVGTEETNSNTIHLGSFFWVRQ